MVHPLSARGRDVAATRIPDPRRACDGSKCEPVHSGRTDEIYHRDIACALCGIFTARWGRAAKCALDGAFLKGAEVLTNRYMEPRGGETDGVVPKWSQLYPNIPIADQYQIYNGPSHIAETKSPLVRTQLENVVESRFGVLRQSGH